MRARMFVSRCKVKAYALRALCFRSRTMRPCSFSGTTTMTTATTTTKGSRRCSRCAHARNAIYKMQYTVPYPTAINDYANTRTQSSLHFQLTYKSLCKRGARHDTFMYEMFECVRMPLPLKIAVGDRSANADTRIFAFRVRSSDSTRACVHIEYIVSSHPQPALLDIT